MGYSRIIRLLKCYLIIFKLTRIDGPIEENEVVQFNNMGDGETIGSVGSDHIGAS
jgi:hypothetical protein